MTRTGLPLGLAALLCAGCLSAPSQQLEPGGLAPLALAEAVRAIVGDLPCEASVGEGTSANMAEVARSPLDLQGQVSVGELWLQGSYAYVARYGTGGVSVVDLADPLQPREVGVWDPDDTTRALDVKGLPDGSAVLVGHDAGIRVLDVRDPRAPALEHEVALATQAHMLVVFEVGGEVYVGATKGDAQDLPLWRVTGSPGAHELQPVASPALTTLTQATGLWGPHDLLRTHDAFFLDDPLAGPTLWVANVWDGVAALDVSDPAAPREVARIPNVLPQYTHTVQTAVVDVQGEPRRITVSVSEVGVNTLEVYDTTDLASPELLAQWHVDNPLQPQHNIQLVWPWLFVAHYTEGVFAFDLERTVARGAPLEPVGRLAAAQADRGSATPSTSAFGALGLFDGTWDVGLRDGLLYLTDDGLRVGAFGCLEPGDPTVRSTG